MTRQQEKVVLQRLATIKTKKMDELFRERSKRARGVASVWRRLADHIGKRAKLSAALLDKMLNELHAGPVEMAAAVSSYLKDLPEYDKLSKAELTDRAELDREFAARENKLNAAAETLAIRLVLGSDANEVIALLDQFGKEKF